MYYVSLLHCWLGAAAHLHGFEVIYTLNGNIVVSEEVIGTILATDSDATKPNNVLTYSIQGK
jgi:hypothetical protein